MTAIEKTKNLIRMDLPVGLLKANKDNPNKMSAREFDLLVDNLGKTGITDPILVRPLDYTLVHDLAENFSGAELVQHFEEAGVQFRIVGGHHRLEAALFVGFSEVPCTIIMDPEFDADEEKFQIVRMNMIRGKMDPAKFFDMFNSMSEHYSEEVLQDAFGFADEAEFKKLINQAAKSLPDAKLQKKFKEAAAEVKTIDGISRLLNEMFTKYGDTVPYGYMVVDYGGKRSLWVRTEKKTMDALDLLGDVCIEQSKTMDDVLGAVIVMLAKGKLPEVMDTVLAAAPTVELPSGLQTTPTKDNIEKVSSL